MYGDLIRTVETLYGQAKADPHHGFPSPEMLRHLKRNDLLVDGVLVRVQVSWTIAPGARPMMNASMSNQTNGEEASKKLKLPQEIVDVVKATLEAQGHAVYDVPSPTAPGCFRQFMSVVTDRKED